jgi:hypothetical protein
VIAEVVKQRPKGPVYIATKVPPCCQVTGHPGPMTRSSSDTRRTCAGAGGKEPARSSDRLPGSDPGAHMVSCMESQSDRV